VRDNPVNYLDPSGRIDQGAEADRAKIIETYLQDMYQVVIQHDWGSYSITIPASPHTPVTTRDCWQPGAWKIKDLELVREGVDLAAGADGLQNKGKFLKAMKGKVYISRWGWSAGSMAPPPPLNVALGDVVLSDTTFSNTDAYAKHTVVHELGHVWDHRSDHQLSFGMMKALNTTFYDPGTGTYIWDPYANPELPAGANPSCTVAEIAQRKSGCYVPYAFTYGAADSFASVAYPQYRTDIKQTNVATPGIRETYVRAQINAVR
jgi:hypothetical protein